MTDPDSGHGVRNASGELLVSETGRMLCVSCARWNCWHSCDEPCDIYRCQCTTGHHDH